MRGSACTGALSGGWRRSTLGWVIVVVLAFALAVGALTRADSRPGGDATPATGASQANRDTLAHAYGRLPLSFIPNKGQIDRSVRYYAQGAGFSFYFTDRTAILSFQRQGRGQALHLRFLGASAGATIEPGNEAKGTVNYMKGDPRTWRTGLPTFGQLAYKGLWPDIEGRFRGAGGTLKYEFGLAPGASVKEIRLAYAGADGLSVSRSGALLIETPLGTLRDSKPRAYQRIGGREVPVQSRYSLGRGGNAYGFELGAYDHSRPLVIDPGIVYSTYLGGTGTDLGNDIALDGTGSAYVTGRTTSVGFPATPGAYDVTPNGAEDAFVTKLDSSGSSLVFSTFLGGTGSDEANGIALDGTGSAYVTGDTTSPDFPTTTGAFDPTSNGDDAFVAKLDPSGSALSYSTFLGGSAGSDIGNAIAVDAAGGAYATGYTSSGSFPTTPGAFDTTYSAGGSFDAFVTKLDPAGSALAYSTYLGGGGGTDTGDAIALDGSGDAYVAGGTSSPAFPTTPGAYDTTANGSDDGFVTKLDAAGSALSYSTYLGGTGTDGAGAIALDGAGNAYLTGFTNSSAFPTTAGVFDTAYNGSGDAFVTKLDAAGSALAYSTYLGGTDPGGTTYDSGTGIAVDGAGSAYVTGRTDSLLFPTTTGAFDTSYNGVGDAFLTKLDPAGSALTYSTYLGGSGTDTGSGIAVGGAGTAYITGYATSSDFPTVAGSFDTSSNGSYDAFVTRLDTTSYEHPSSAMSIAVSLTPVFRQCGPGNAPNGQHSPPLGVGSCNPPQPTAANARVGTTSVGVARIDVISGDVALSDQITDVQDAAGNDFDPGNPSSGCSTSGPCGDLASVVRMRFTDRGNCAPAPCSAPSTQQGTSTDLDFGPVPIDCVPQGPATTAPGSSCSVTTTANTLIPGSVVSGREANVQVFRVRILDNSTAVPTLFEQQGILIP